ncbi:sensor histidine kinase [Pseudoxanthomonas wuyuanensis]|uniref:Histidine kinase n=1 Tax=Pseudoxanthomonas wuyuanensis TaxID=1073196 RepID=A0A286D302_9GAMM|nr:histidine kinase [Pseudoxanthomonas wuyuanensis]KAF1723040.1 hypothetical protein CSC75_00690 [Pseudoxanthomonas wuyuanensis]SOD53017.1 Histidine kinase [Pseudoxanthomonas wuyuanensis]
MFRRKSLLWWTVFAGWTLFGVVLSVETLTLRNAAAPGTGLEIGHALRTGLASAWLWVPLTVGLLALVQRFPIGRDRIALPVLLHAMAVLAIILLRALAVYALNRWIGWYAELPEFSLVLTASVAKNFLIGWLIVGVAHAFLYYERSNQRERHAVELEASLMQTRLQALSAQLNPHFLFNALNSVSELVHRNPAAADRMLVSLGQLLRASLDRSSVQQVPLREELALLERYVDLEKMRLGDRLHMHWEIDRSLLSVPVPRLLLQPLVENAIHHAIAPRLQPGRVVVGVRRSGDELVLEVHDDGQADPAQPGNGHGIGLANTRARLRALYGENHAFELTRTAGDDGTVARVRLPLRALELAA